MGSKGNDMVNATLYSTLTSSFLLDHLAITGDGGHLAGGVSAREDQNKGLSATLPLVTRGVPTFSFSV